MPCQLVLSVRERAVPGLNRGWRTPDPSPTRDPDDVARHGVASWSSYEMTEASEILDADASDSSTHQAERAAGTVHACEIVGAGNPSGQDFDRLDVAWARFRTPSPEARTLAPCAPLAWPQGIPFGQQVLAPAGQAGAVPDTPHAHIRMPSLEARALAPRAPWAWSQGVPEKPQQMPFGEPRVEPPPPPPPLPPAHAAGAALRGRAGVQEPKTAMAKQRCPPPERTGMPQELGGVLSVGSVGHPYACEAACKFVRKSRGCKLGADCSRCHACVWNRYEANRAARNVGGCPPCPVVR
ncbi:unnamed protein product [Prorocentrum cordatum]|uniref:C3H1-type domain-containing protein n=1 Tax=Prorocentrum cordatum TaxID=2364126 RepID=A0ABN9X4V0_9DINO|nr:unnamed protein product [Polarella glacialis]